MFELFFKKLRIIKKNLISHFRKKNRLFCEKRNICDELPLKFIRITYAFTCLILKQEEKRNRNQEK